MAKIAQDGQPRSLAPADRNEPLAICGIGCRFAGGVEDPASLWRLLRAGEDGVVEIPSDRFATWLYSDPKVDAIGKTFVRHAAITQKSMEYFDTAFFDITPREAEDMDPNHRWILECCQEAFDDAMLPQEYIRGSRTGVYMGIFGEDHLVNSLQPYNRPKSQSTSPPGIGATMASNRVSHCFDLTGPSFSLDTACSSSLTAFHYGCQDIRTGQADLALIGASNVIFRPEYMLGMAKGGFLAPDGISKAFDERADGYGRGDGVGVVLVMGESTARRLDLPIYARVLGTGANQDGRTPGITVPNSQAQADLITEVYARTGADTGKTQYFEAHGTGTPAGDPNEVKAIGETVAGPKGSREQPLLVGSLKANIGHTEATAGIAGIIKAALTLQHGEAPPQANLQRFNPDIPFDSLDVAVPTEPQPLGGQPGERQASVNSFGYGGSNAHAILADAKDARRPFTVTTPTAAAESANDSLRGDGAPAAVPVTGGSGDGLRAAAGAYASYLQANNVPAPDFWRTVAHRRTHLSQRALIWARDRKELVSELQTLADGGTPSDAVTERTRYPGTKGPIAVFTGMGTQWWGMARQLLDTDPVFQAEAKRVDDAFVAEAGWSIIDELRRDEGSSRVTENWCAQPANFLVQAGLHAVWRSMGIRPVAVLGHSVGEVSAAYAAGSLSLTDAVKVSYHRSRVQQKAAGRGRMLACGAGKETVAGLAEDIPGAEIAAINGPSTCAVAGDEISLQTLAERLEDRGLFNRYLLVEVPYHSSHMDGLESEIRDSLADIQPHTPEIPLISTVTGEQITGAEQDADYWWRNVRQPVRFADGVRTAVAMGLGQVYLEVGPHPVLAGGIQETAREAGSEVGVFKTLKRKENDHACLRTGLSQLFAAGVRIDWTAHVSPDGELVDLPVYPWQRSYCWNEAIIAAEDRKGWAGHPLIGTRTHGPTVAWGNRISPLWVSWLDDHVIDGVLILPGASYLEMALAAHNDFTGADVSSIEDVNLERPVVVDRVEAPSIQLELDHHHRHFEIHSRGSQDGAQWVRHVSGAFSHVPPDIRKTVDLNDIIPPGTEEINVEGFYDDLANRGVELDNWFRGVHRVWGHGNHVLAWIQVPEGLDGPDRRQYMVHPALLDCALQCGLALFLDADWTHQVGFIPTHIERASIAGQAPDGFWCWMYMDTSQAPNALYIDLSLIDENGQVFMDLDTVSCVAVQDPYERLRQKIETWLYRYHWEDADQPVTAGEEPVGHWLVLGDAGGVAQQIRTTIEARGGTAEICDVAGNRAAELDARGVNPAPVSDLLSGYSWDGISGVIAANALDAGEPDDPIALRASTELLKLYNALPTSTNPRLVTPLSQGGFAATNDRIRPDQRCLMGFMRVVRNERPEIGALMVDIGENPHDVEALGEVIAGNTDEDELARRQGQWMVPRLLHSPTLDSPETARSLREGEAYEIQAPRIGVGQQPRAIQMPEPNAGEVVVHAVDTTVPSEALQRPDGLLREDKLGGLGLPHTLGVVGEMGAGVSGLGRGQYVLPLAPAIPPVSHQRLAAERVVPLPYANLDFNQAARLAGLGGILGSWCYALTHMANVRKGQRVLLHTGDPTWDEGLRRLCLWLGAEPEVLSPNGHPAEAVQGGAQAKKAHALIEGHSGEVASKALRLLKPYGRAVLVGNADITSGLTAAGNTAVMRFDPVAVTQDDPEGFRGVLHEVWEALRNGDLDVPAYRAAGISGHLEPPFGRRDTSREDAGEREQGSDPTTLAQVGLSPGPKTVLPAFWWINFRRDGTYLVTGGFRGFGRELSRWLADSGAGGLILVSRSGPRSQDDVDFVAELREKGVAVMARACDVADEDSLAALLGEARGSMPPIRGVFHAAAVLHDVALANMTEDVLAKVMKPKAIGAVNLDRQTREDPIRHFVLFSSISALAGQPGQANYASANSFLGGLAQARRAQGLPAMAIALGALGEVGMLSRDQETETMLTNMGLRPMAPKDVLIVMSFLLQLYDPGHVGLVDIDWQTAGSVLGRTKRFSKLGAGEGREMPDTLKEVLELPAGERSEALVSRLTNTIAESVRLDPERIDPQVGLTEYGVDSLTATEVQLAIQREFGVGVSMLEITGEMGVAYLAELVLHRWGIDDSDMGSADRPGVAA